MRTPLIAGLGAAVALSIVAVMVLRPKSPEADVPPPAAPVAALPLPLPAAPQTPVAPATSTASAPSTPAPARTTAGQIGAEGYGPHIERAHASNDPKAAWEAVEWLRLCVHNESRRKTAEDLRNQGVAPEFMTQRIVEVDAEARRCQTVTEAHRALLPPLAARAMRAGVPEAAAAYAEAVFPADLTPQQRIEVAEGLRRDALGGNELSLLAAAASNRAWGLTDEERLTYLFALTQLPKPMLPPETALQMIQIGHVPLKAPPTPAQVTAALQAARELVARSAQARRP